jgi:hypothetical protein
MTITIDPYTIPEKGPVHLEISRSFEIKVTAEDARHQVNRWVHNEVTYLMRALPPTLVVGEQVVWRVPVSIGFPSVGQAGLVGAVDVDVESGIMYTSAELEVELINEAEKIAERLPPFQPHKLPPEYLAKRMPQAPELVVP